MLKGNFGKYLRESMQVSALLLDECENEVEETIAKIIEAYQSGGSLYLCGNGGSAADSQHIAAEFVNGMSESLQYPLPAVALTTDTSVITSRANDYAFDTIFSRQLEAIGRPGDVLFGISTSGTSKNIVEAIKCAKRLGISTILLSGARTSPKVEKIADIEVRIPSSETQHIQESMLIIEHYICAEVIKHFLNI